MNNWMKVARFHLADRVSYTVLPWGVLGFDFLIWLLLAAAAGGGPSAPIPSGAILAIYVFFAIAGALSIFRSLPFAFALGIGRRSYYAGTTLLAITLAAIYGLALSVLAVIERVSDGWGDGLHFFRVAYILAGPWYLDWLTSFVVLSLLFFYGMWFGLVYRRWNVLGLLAFVAGQVLALVIGAAIADSDQAWPAIGRFFTTIGAAGLTGLLAVLAVLLLTGGYATMRRVTV
jgi:hypothetical protein